MPVICGSTTHKVATAATAASAALPPSRNVSTAAKVASGCEVAAIPLRAITGERPGKWKSRLMSVPKCENLRNRVVDALDGEIALRRTQRHGKSADHVNE